MSLTADLYARLPAEQRSELAEIADEISTLETAVSAYLDGTTSGIAENYAAAQALEARIRAVLTTITATYEPTLVAGISEARDAQRWVIRLLASPEIWRSNLDVLLDSLNECRGNAESITKARAVRRYMVVQGDTLQSIAQTQIGDAARWGDIALLNDLSYPYLSSDESYAASAKATGVVTFSHVSVQVAEYVIPAGTVVATVEDDGSEGVLFITTEAATIGAGELTATAAIEALEAGAMGNVGPGAITVVSYIAASTVYYTYTLGIQVSDVAANESSTLTSFGRWTYPSVTNLAATSGGKDGAVARPGEWILVPVDHADGIATNVLQAQGVTSATTRLYGTDLWLSETGGLERNARGDVRIVSGVDNLAVAARVACQTERGDLTWHPDYGSYLYKVVGSFRDDDLEARILVEVREAVLADIRFESVAVTSFDFDGTSAEVGIEFITRNLVEAGSSLLIVRVR